MADTPKITVAACRLEMNRRLSTTENNLYSIVSPEGSLTQIKSKQNKVLGGIAAVAVLLGFAAFVIGLLLNNMSCSIAEAKEQAEVARSEAYTVKVTNAVLEAEIKNLGEKIVDQTKKIDSQTVLMGRLVITIQDLRSDIHEIKMGDK